MSGLEIVKRVVQPLSDAVSIEAGPSLRVHKPDAARHAMEGLARLAALGPDPDRRAARWLIREIAISLGAIPASIHDYYLARGRGETRDDFTVPAMNLRALPFHAARAVFRVAKECDAKAFIFEIARSEIGYTAQRPAEYAACMLAAAVAEGYQGPVFIQGDHFQISAKRYAQDPQAEVETIRSLTREAVAAGFFNIDIDTSTLVDLSRQSIPDQQERNYTLCAQFTDFIRSIEPPGVTISVGGEIGEVGGHNSTEPELRAFMEGFNATLAAVAPDSPGLSKISIQTGTSHGGVVLPDGSIARVKVDFDTLALLSRIAKQDYGLAGAVQHGASTLPEEAFPRFTEAGTCEVHLATNFQNILYDCLPQDLLKEIHAYLDAHHADERKPAQTDEQFYYKTRKRALGAFKKRIWDLPQPVRERVEQIWEDQFRRLFGYLNVGGTSSEVERFVSPAVIHEPLMSYLGDSVAQEDVSDLAD